MKTYTKKDFIQRIIDCGKDYNEGILILGFPDTMELYWDVMNFYMSSKDIFSSKAVHIGFGEKKEFLNYRNSDNLNIESKIITINSFLRIVSDLLSDWYDEDIVLLVSKEERNEIGDWCYYKEHEIFTNIYLISIDQDDYINYKIKKVA